MAKVKIKNLGKVEASIKKLFEEIRTDQATLVEMAEILENDVKGFTRSGKSVSTNKQFKPLTQGWVKQRAYLQAQGNAPGEYFLNRTKSNLTFTGKFINLWKSKILKTKGAVELAPQGTHPGYVPGGRAIDAKELAQYLADAGRPVFSFSKEFKARLARRFNVLLKRKIRSRIKQFGS